MSALSDIGTVADETLTIAADELADLAEGKRGTFAGDRRELLSLLHTLMIAYGSKRLLVTLAEVAVLAHERAVEIDSHGTSMVEEIRGHLVLASEALS